MCKQICRQLAIPLVAWLVLGLSVGLASADDMAPTSTPTPTQTSTPTQTPTPTVTPEPTRSLGVCHPISLMISMFFDVKCEEIDSLHDNGIGFGVIGRAYLTALATEGQVTPEQVIELHQAGVGWGEIAKQYGIHPGGNGLGKIMSGKGAGLQATSPVTSTGESASGVGASNGTTDSWPGNSGNAPGHNKPPTTENGNGKDKNPRASHKP